MADNEVIIESDFFKIGQPPSSNVYMDDGQLFDPDPFWPNPQDLAAYYTPDNWMLPSAPSFGTSSPASSDFQGSSSQSLNTFADDTAIDTFAYNMASERLLPPPGESYSQHPTETTELPQSASSAKEDDLVRSPAVDSKSQQRVPVSARKPTGRQLPKGDTRGRNAKATQRRGKRGALKVGRRASGPFEDEGYRKRLEGNRLAAERSRQRRRDEAQALVSKGEALESRNQYLCSYYNLLKHEVLRTRMELLQHTDCNCVLIRQYIAREAQRTVNGLSPGVSTSTSRDGRTTDSGKGGEFNTYDNNLLDLLIDR